jgi:hypothetical protein
MVLFILSKRQELNIFVPETTYSSLVQIFTILWNLNLQKEMLNNKSNYFLRFSRVVPL